MTERLYYDDSLRLDFDATLVAVRRDGGGGESALILDRSAFYPESGGQMADHGWLRWNDHELRVTDVQVEGDRVVHHVDRCPEALAPGARLVGAIDARRRRLHMAEHTGQHILSRALLDEAGATTVSSRLGESGCTIDVDVESLSPEALSAVEAAANTVIDDDVPVVAGFPSDDELAAMSLRKAPKVEEAIRVVQIGDFDATPCGGTHCHHAAQVGLVSLLGTERRKRRLRIHFAAGMRARQLLSAQADTLRNLGRELSSAPEDVPFKVERLQADLREARRQSQDVCATLSAQLLAGDGPQVVDLAHAPIELLRELAKRAAQRPGAVVVAATREGDQLAVLAARGDGATFDCGAFIRRLQERAEGRGGGKPERAEGRFALEAPFAALAHEMLELQSTSNRPSS